MKRRDLITVVAGSALASPLLAGSALAGGPTEEKGGGGAQTIEMRSLGLPVIVDGRIRNYVFVEALFTLFPGANPTTVRAKEPYFRDALVKAAHARPFSLPDDWSRLNGGAIARELIRLAPGLAGRGAVARVEITRQTPRRMTGMRPR